MTTEEGNKLVSLFMGAVEETGYFQASTIGRTQVPTGRMFMKDRFPSNMHLCKESELQYHASWDWLMPVVEKIEETSNYEKDRPFFSVESFDIKYDKQYPNRKSRGWISICTKLNGLGSEFHSIKSEPNDSKIIAVWETVVQFIQWYNSQKQLTPP